MRTLILGLCICLMETLSAECFTVESGSCEWLKHYITPVQNFPIEGVQFQWYAHLLKEPKAFRRAILTFADHYRDYQLDAIAALDSRGFIFGSALAYELGIPLVLIRKPGKLPRRVERIDYALEYGTSSFELEHGSIDPFSVVLVIDDVVATGGSARAACDLVEQFGAMAVEVACLIEISHLNGRDVIDRPVFSLIAAP